MLWKIVGVAAALFLIWALVRGIDAYRQLREDEKDLDPEDYGV